jgi:hypothetical protein
VSSNSQTASTAVTPTLVDQLDLGHISLVVTEDGISLLLDNALHLKFAGRF